ncbi:AMP-binding protein [Verrucomicrobia bacterium]|nr:AMP-binding protein [Verrucomicrobiota bacterium]
MGIVPERSEIEAHQLAQLNVLLSKLIPANSFQTRRLSRAGIEGPLESLQEFFQKAPFTTKADLQQDREDCPPYGDNLTFPIEQYIRHHQTSGTTSGKPMPWLDSDDSWQWMVDGWVEVFQAAGITSEDRIYFAFSFGPFIGFWLAFEAGAKLGCLCLPGGGLSSEARLKSILLNEATVLCCTPTYAIRLAEVAKREGIDLAQSKVKTLVLAGEPGASIPATRAKLEALWPGARPFDHHGMTEVGAVTYESPDRPGNLQIIETSYIAEVINSETGEHTSPGETGELVLTTLGRTGSPVLRYRTGDLVKNSFRPIIDCVYNSSLGSDQMILEGGILGRSDDMVIVRGVNVYPSAIEQIVREAGGVAEYRVDIKTVDAMSEIHLAIELEEASTDENVLIKRLTKAFQHQLSLRVPIEVVESLPRFELKARRWNKTS